MKFLCASRSTDGLKAQMIPLGQNFKLEVFFKSELQEQEFWSLILLYLIYVKDKDKGIYQMTEDIQPQY